MIVMMQTKTRDAVELRQSLTTFTRLATSLRNVKEARNLGQLEAVEQEIDAIRRALGYQQGGFAA